MPLSTAKTIAYEDMILIVGKDRHPYLRVVKPGQRFECNVGYIPYEDLVGVPFGTQVRTHLGHKVFVLPPHTDDVIRYLQRDGQIIYPKDLGYIALKLGIQPGVHVVEAGTGSGALTLMLALLVGAEGRVTSYERSAKMQHRAISNLRRVGLEERVTFKQRDISEGFDETDVYALFLDVKEPWLYLPQARAALRGGGFFGAIVPTANQIIDLTEALYHGPWYMMEVEELILRAYKTIPARIRPDEQMVGHTGYLIFARAVERDVRGQPESDSADNGEDDANGEETDLSPDDSFER